MVALASGETRLIGAGNREAVRSDESGARMREMTALDWLVQWKALARNQHHPAGIQLCGGDACVMVYRGGRGWAAYDLGF